MESELTLVDLLDRVLDKGLVIQADVIIAVAGIPLIGLNLRAALAGMETMLNHGLMRSWDEQIRAEAVREESPTFRKVRKRPLLADSSQKLGVRTCKHATCSRSKAALAAE